MFQVIIPERAEKEFAKLPIDIQKKFYSKFLELEKNPFACQIKKLQGYEFSYRIRIGRWRILFAMYSKEKRIEIIDIFLKKGEQDYKKRRGLLN
jgi:mRNA interferase RelE/StbE